MPDTITTQFDVPATMRDGTVLRANIFRPADNGQYPVALTRTPYGKDFASVTPILDAVRLARAGYIVVIQDVRGRFTSEGRFAPFRHEAEDGYDTVEWAARLPGSTGAVGMWGASYFGFTQWVTAVQAPPALKAIVPTITWADARDGASWRGGAFELGLSAYWQLGSVGLTEVFRRLAQTQAAPEARAQTLGAWLREANTLRDAGYWSLPLRDFAPFRRLDLVPEWPDYFTHVNERAYSTFYSPRERYSGVTVPSLNVGGWYDIFSQGTLDSFVALRETGSTPAARQARLVMGPWAHVNYGHVVGETDFGFAAQMGFMNLQIDLTGLTQRWFDTWLKGMDTGMTQEPPVRLFVMGDNVWRDEAEWPLARAQATPYYLRRGERLSPTPPDDEHPDHYTYDPADPTPTWGGAVLMNPLYTPGVKDQRPVEARPDVLVYTTDPLERDVEVTGRILVTLWAASDAPDTDFVARLVDVHPDGFAQNLTDGIIRARFRDGDTPKLLTPGEPTEFTIDLWSTANVFKAGHRIRLDIASANFPRWDRNPNTGAPFGVDASLRPARQTVFHDAAHPSHVTLPIIPR